jgi:hypothetical protein
MRSNLLSAQSSKIKITSDNEQSFCCIDAEREVDRMPPQASVTGVRTVTLRLNVSANLERPMSLIGLSVFPDVEREGRRKKRNHWSIII